MPHEKQHNKPLIPHLRSHQTLEASRQPLTSSRFSKYPFISSLVVRSKFYSLLNDVIHERCRNGLQAVELRGYENLKGY